MKILVVDDTEANRKLLSWILEDDGHQVIEAGDGKEAVDLFKKDIPDMVLMDVMMPVMDGYEATIAIKEFLGDRHVPIIFLTALSDDASLAKCLSIGGDDFLSKPINEQVLQAKIKAHSRIRELNEQINTKNEELKRLHAHTMREHEIAKAVFERAMAASLQDCANARHYVSAATTFNGDLLLTAPSPSGGLYTLLCDFTGHGLPAAIGALPVSQIFYDTTNDGKAVSDIASEINKALEKFLPDDMFAVAAICELNSEGNRLTLWSGGLPDVFVTDARGKLKFKIHSTHMPLGVLNEEEFERDVKIYEMETGDRVYLYSDGIPEALNPRGEMYGEERLQQMFNGERKDPFVRLIYDIKQFTGPEQNDDITIIELICKPVEMEHETTRPEELPPQPPWKIQLDLDAKDLKGASPVSTLIDMMGASPLVLAHKDFLHTILSELFSNALEHGVLGLNSKLKRSEDGYLEYYQQREEKLSQLEAGFVRIAVEFKADTEKAEVHIDVKDSGNGFDINRIYRSKEDDAFGRGVSLINTLCDQVQYSDNGSRVQATYVIR
ncbi:MAG: fused response regulator/phosphatase [Ketobacteraceae bacterium]|nr:fused response regulator/phosphatase [Ketobacteraceae bacterium]